MGIIGASAQSNPNSPVAGPTITIRALTAECGEPLMSALGRKQTLAHAYQPTDIADALPKS